MKSFGIILNFTQLVIKDKESGYLFFFPEQPRGSILSWWAPDIKSEKTAGLKPTFVFM